MRRQDLDALVPGAILIVGVPADVVTSTRPRIVAWQLVQLDERCSYTPIGDRVRNRRDAELLGQRTFPFIVRWRRIDPAAFLGVVGGATSQNPAA